MNKKKIFITGHKGFIANAIIQKLKLNNILEASNKNDYEEVDLEFGYIDLNNRDNWINLLKNTKCIIHCAGKTNLYKKDKKNSLEIFRKFNTETTKILAQEAAKLGIKRLIFLSTIGVNGNFTKTTEYFTYKDQPNPSNYYAISKWEAEQELLKISNQTGIEIVIIRAPLVYGFGTKGNFMRLIKLINSGLPLPFGLIKNKRSFIGIDNLVDVVIRCIFNDEAKNKTFLVSDGKDLSTPDLINYISSAMQRSVRLFPFPLPILSFLSSIVGKSKEINQLTRSLQIDIKYTKKILNWTPSISVQEGINRMIKFK